MSSLSCSWNSRKDTIYAKLGAEPQSAVLLYPLLLLKWFQGAIFFMAICCKTHSTTFPLWLKSQDPSNALLLSVIWIPFNRLHRCNIQRYTTIQGRVLVKEFFCSKQRNKGNCVACDCVICAVLGSSDLHGLQWNCLIETGLCVCVCMCLWAGEKERKKEKLGPWKGRRSEILQTAALKNVFSIKSPDIWYLQN